MQDAIEKMHGSKELEKKNLENHHAELFPAKEIDACRMHTHTILCSAQSVAFLGVEW